MSRASSVTRTPCTAAPCRTRWCTRLLARCRNSARRPCDSISAAWGAAPVRTTTGWARSMTPWRRRLGAAALALRAPVARGVLVRRRGRAPGGAAAQPGAADHRRAAGGASRSRGDAAAARCRLVDRAGRRRRAGPRRQTSRAGPRRMSPGPSSRCSRARSISFTAGWPSCVRWSWAFCADRCSG